MLCGICNIFPLEGFVAFSLVAFFEGFLSFELGLGDFVGFLGFLDVESFFGLRLSFSGCLSEFFPFSARMPPSPSCMRAGPLGPRGDLRFLPFGGPSWANQPFGVFQSS